MTKTVLLIGARGFLGSQVLAAVLRTDKSYNIKALIREGSNASAIESMGVTVVRGDTMKPESLESAFEGVDVVINTANGYSSGHPEVDTEGAANVVDAVKKMNVKRYVYCGVLTADKATTVEHFHHKFLAEEYMKEQGVPYISLRPGAFLDQADDYLGDSIKKDGSFAICPWNSKSTKLGMIFTADLAQYFADCIDLPASADRLSIDVGWTQTVSYQDVVDIVNNKLDRKIAVYGLPWVVRMALIYTVGWFSANTSEMLKMFNYFDTGLYVNETSLQEKFFGKAPTPEDAVGRYVDKLLSAEK